MISRIRKRDHPRNPGHGVRRILLRVLLSTTLAICLLFALAPVAFTQDAALYWTGKGRLTRFSNPPYGI